MTGDWFFVPELVALGVFLVIILYMRGAYSISVRHSKEFYWTLWICFMCIAINVISIYFIMYASQLPLWLSNMGQLLFFATMPLMPAALVKYILLQVRDEIKDKRPFAAVDIFIGITLTINLILVLVTPATGALYYFNEQMEYVRGPLNFVTMALSILYLLLGVILCVSKFKFISPQLQSALKGFPLLVFILVSIQAVLPNFQLAGTAAMFFSLVCYLNFQSTKLTTDPITMCGNRLVFLSTLGYYMKHRQPLTVLAFNIRQFKRVNEELGTITGDQLLRYIGDTLRNLPYPAEVFRIGGDKFAMICISSRSTPVESMVGSITNLFSSPWTVDNVRIVLEIDLVTMMCPQVSNEPNDILSLLEYAMSLPPDTSGENNIPAQVETRVCDMRMRNMKVRREEVVSLLRLALLENSFQYVYQPIFDIDGLEIHAAECLLRLQDPKTGKMIPPSEFIPIAESVGLIPLIGLKVFENVCRFINNCTRNSVTVPPISVNFSTRQFYNEDVCTHVQTLLKRWEVDASQIKIEVTESTFIANYHRVENAMSKLNEIGIGFYLDDFGTGYASFSRMLSLPFECIKFDQSILSTSLRQRRMHEMLGYLVDGFSHLSTRVVVEGVETADQVRYLKKLKVQEVQGFFYSKPMAEKAFYNSLVTSQLNEGKWQYQDRISMR